MSNSSLVSYIKLSPNHSGKRKRKIDTITIHVMAGNVSVETCGEIFANPARQASSNYGIGSDGRIALYVDEANRSWCSSNEANDQRAVTIEVANSVAKHPWPITEKAYNALLDLVTDICQRNDIKELKWLADKSLIGQVDKQNMTVHRWFAAKACPGDYLYERHGAIAEEVNRRLNEDGAEPENKPETELYRVREAWDKPDTQKGAFKVLRNAQKKADEHGLSVFNSAGEKVYPKNGSVTDPKVEPEEPAPEKTKLAGAKYKNSSAASGLKFKVNAAVSLNIRTSPSAKDKSNIIKAVKRGATCTWYGYYTDNWYLVQFSDKTVGYVNKNYLKRM